MNLALPFPTQISDIYRTVTHAVYYTCFNYILVWDVYLIIFWSFLGNGNNIIALHYCVTPFESEQ